MNIYTFCEYTYNFSHIPIYLYTNRRLSANIHSHPESIILPEMIADQILNNSEPISLYETTIGSYYGQIYLEQQNISVILGPVIPLKYTEDNLQVYFHAYAIPVTERETYQTFLSLIPSFSLLSFVMLLHQMNYAITDGKTTLTQEILSPYHLDGIPTSIDFTRHNKSNLEKGYHNTLYETQAITMPMIKNGDYEGLVRYSKNLLPMNYGIYSTDPRKQQLVVLIISLTNAMTAAIQGGLDQQTALSMVELYIREGLLLSSPADIDALSMTAIVEFTKRVRDEKQSMSVRPSIYDCIQYMRERIYTHITVAEIADHAGYTTEHFSRLFKKESGFTASEFIISCKLYESKKLLKFTNMTIGEISNQLYFSNQSHFQRLFKKKFQMTPLQFRNSDTQI